MSWYIVITDWMRELGLTGNDLLVYAVIYGYSQRADGAYFGSASSLGERIGIEKRSILRILKRLTEAGYIKKTDIYKDGVKFCAYEVGDNLSPGAVTKDHRGGDNLSPNNKVYNESFNKLSKSESVARARKFVVPTPDEVRQYAEGIGYRMLDADYFCDYYAQRGWPLKDWQAAVRNWKRRDDEKAVKATRPAADNLKTYDELFGNNG